MIGLFDQHFVSIRAVGQAAGDDRHQRKHRARKDVHPSGSARFETAPGRESYSLRYGEYEAPAPGPMYRSRSSGDLYREPRHYTFARDIPLDGEFVCSYPTRYAF